MNVFEISFAQTKKSVIYEIESENWLFFFYYSEQSNVPEYIFHECSKNNIEKSQIILHDDIMLFFKNIQNTDKPCLSKCFEIYIFVVQGHIS